MENTLNHNVNQSASFTTHNSSAVFSLPTTGSSHPTNQNSNNFNNGNGGRNPYRANPNRFKSNRKSFNGPKPFQQQQHKLGSEVDGEIKGVGAGEGGGGGGGKAIENLPPEAIKEIDRDICVTDGVLTEANKETFIDKNNTGIKQNVKDKRRPRQNKNSSYQPSNNFDSSLSSNRSNYGGPRNGGGGGGSEIKKVKYDFL